MPNILCVIRITGSIVLLLVKPLSALFFIIYAVCGISDMFDGYIARRTKSTSQLGATLDSMADVTFIAVLLFIFLPILEISSWMLLWIGIIAVVRIGSLAIGWVKYRTAAFLHTYANKATGFALFCFPMLYSAWGLGITAALLCGIATLSAVEELMINLTSTELSRDIKGIFVK